MRVQKRNPMADWPGSGAGGHGAVRGRRGRCRTSPLTDRDDRHLAQGDRGWNARHPHHADQHEEHARRIAHCEYVERHRHLPPELRAYCRAADALAGGGRSRSARAARRTSAAITLADRSISTSLLTRQQPTIWRVSTGRVENRPASRPSASTCDRRHADAELPRLLHRIGQCARPRRLAPCSAPIEDTRPSAASCAASRSDRGRR